MLKGKINIELCFPIISFVNNEVSISQSLKEYAVCRRKDINMLRRQTEVVVDSQGVLYQRIWLEPLKNINIFNGFSLKFASFGVCYVSVGMKIINALTNYELKHYGKEILLINNSFYSETMLPIERWRSEFEELSHREDILRYMFYFAGTSYYQYPDKKDVNWRRRMGIVN